MRTESTSSYKASPMTWEALSDLAKVIPQPPPAYCVANPEYAKRLMGEIPTAPEDGLKSVNVVKFDCGSIQIIEKPGQRAAAWFLSSPLVLRSYLSGFISEDDLTRLSVDLRSSESICG